MAFVVFSLFCVFAAPFIIYYVFRSVPVSKDTLSLLKQLRNGVSERGHKCSFNDIIFLALARMVDDFSKTELSHCSDEEGGEH